jgi:hypothetical protein
MPFAVEWIGVVPLGMCEEEDIQLVGCCCNQISSNLLFHTQNLPIKLATGQGNYD